MFSMPPPPDEKESGWKVCPTDGQGQMQNSLGSAFDGQQGRKTKLSDRGLPAFHAFLCAKIQDVCEAAFQ